jgi:UDP-N-acetyl-2-amino-2-deoxyglucuronate dehydrogenase
MTNRKISFGLIGCGSVAPFHVHAIRRAANTSLRMVADADPTLAEAFGRRFNVAAARSVDELLQNPAIDAVTIAAPHAVLPELGIHAALAGKHVIVEKPGGARSRDAEQFVAACQRAGVKSSVWLERRYQPFAIKARELVQAGTLGKVFLVLVSTLLYKAPSYWTYGFRNDGPPGSWRTSKQDSGGGVLLMNTIHQLDLAAFITGLQITEVFGRTLEPSCQVETLALVNSRCLNGELVNVISSSSAFGIGPFPIYASRDLIIGTEGSIILNAPLELKHRVLGNKNFEVPLLDLTEAKTIAIEQFAQAILEDREPPVAVRDMITGLAVVEAAYQSAAQGRPVQIHPTQLHGERQADQQAVVAS